MTYRHIFFFYTTYKHINFFYTTYKHNFFFKMTYKHKNKIKSHTYVFSNDNICPLILKRHIYTFYVSFICRIIFNGHFHVMYYKQPCRLQPTTSYHTVLGFPILARVTAHNFSNFDFHLRDFLPDSNSQGYRFAVSLFFLSV